MPVSEKKLAGAVYGNRVSLCVEALSEAMAPRLALAWVVESQPALQDKIPADLLETDAGFTVVAAVVDQLCGTKLSNLIPNSPAA